MYSQDEIDVFSLIAETITKQVLRKDWEKIESNYWWVPKLVRNTNFGIYNGIKISLNELSLIDMDQWIDVLIDSGKKTNRAEWRG